jgi:hypothetical protein
MPDAAAMDISNDRHQLPTPPTGDSGDQPEIGRHLPDDPAAKDAPLKQRIARNPANLGDEVADEGDVTFPDPAPQPVQI